MKVPLKLKNENFECKLLNHPEIVKNYRGKYFVIDLKQTDIQEIIHFETGKYFIEDFNIYGKALAEFGEDVVKKLNNSSFNSDYRIFIKGSADSLGNSTYSFNLDNRYLYHNICYYSSYSSSITLFESKKQCVEIREPLSNQHLPNLRAEFLKHKFESFYALINVSPTILDGKVTFQVSDEDRNATIFLFLPDKFFN